MPDSVAVRRTLLPALAAATAATVGLWLGFAACGGYAWNTPVGYGLVAVSAVLAATNPTHGTNARRALLAIIVVGVFLLARGIGVALYAGTSSPGEYLRQLGATFASGPC